MQYTATSGLRAAVCAALFAGSAWFAGSAVAAPAARADEVQQMLQWVHANRDHRGKPFAIVDKKNARLHVFHADGTHAGSSTALLGATYGDFIAPGVGERAQRGQVRTSERTTPAGRFEAEPGINLSGEHVVWADYESAFAIHRLRPGRSQQSRAARLQSPRAADHRVSLGCVIVPVAFYIDVVQRVLGKHRSVVYVLPETRSMAEVFAGG